MIIRNVYKCKECENCFDTIEECLEHEEKCSVMRSFVCDKCGSETTWHKDDLNRFAYMNQCHILHMDTPSYGSVLDGVDIDFQICDDCLGEFIGSFVKIRNIK